MRPSAIRLLASTAAGALALVLAGLPASAAPAVPNGEPFSYTSPGTYGPSCDFPLEVSGVANQPDRVTLPNGIIVFAGAAVATVTNLQTGNSATYNASGPVQYDPKTQRVTVFGRNLIIGPEGQTGSAEPFLILTSGKVSFVLGQPIDEALRGHVSHDVCAELAS